MTRFVAPEATQALALDPEFGRAAARGAAASHSIKSA
jgi:hypothetical protein